MKHAFCILVLICTAVVWAQTDPVEQAQSLFKQGDYLAGMNLLTAELNSPDAVKQAAALEAFARYQEELVGNYDYALRLYQSILKNNLPKDDPLKADAKEQMARIIELKSRYRAEDVLLRSLQPPEVAKPDRCDRQTMLLRSIMESKPDYYRNYEVFYHLGRHYLVTQDYRRSCELLDRALQLKPAINFYLPLHTCRERAHRLWVQSNVNKGSFISVGVLLAVTIVSFYAARPWRWVRMRHLAIGFAGAALWVIVFAVFYKLTAARQIIPDESQTQISIVPPFYPDFGPGSPYWHVAQNLCIYGLVGTLGVFVFAVGAAKFKRRWMAVMGNGIFSVLLFGTLLTIFYMYNCNEKSVFYSVAQQGSLGRLNGASYFVNYGMEPYILTNPKAYPDLALENVSDAHMYEWVKRYCTFSTPEKESK
ncbi:MAG: hypothetical protein LLF76_13815 [Planctomycetaceae bacterium]|nr:hypothetical protein [Planctomycetaceae bacterium]